MDEEITTQQPLPQPALDEESIASLRELGDDDSFMLDLLGQYVEQADRLILAIAEAVRADDVKSWVGTMHSLAGSSRNVGALRLGAVCTAAEVDGRTSGRINQLPFVHDLDTEYDAVKKEIAVLRNRE